MRKSLFLVLMLAVLSLSVVGCDDGKDGEKGADAIFGPTEFNKILNSDPKIAEKIKGGKGDTGDKGDTGANGSNGEDILLNGSHVEKAKHEAAMKRSAALVRTLAVAEAKVVSTKSTWDAALQVVANAGSSASGNQKLAAFDAGQAYQKAVVARDTAKAAVAGAK